MPRITVSLAIVLLAGCADIPTERLERDRVIMSAVQPCKEQYAERLYGVDMMSVLPSGRVRFWYKDGNVSASYDIERCLNEATKDLRLGPWLRGRMTRGGPTSVPITTVGKDALVQVRVNGILGTMVVRTAVSFSFITEDFAKRAGVAVVKESPLIRVTVGGKPAMKPYARMRAVEVGDAQVEALDVVVYEAVTGLPSADGILGRSFLDNFKATVDRSTGKLTLDPIEKK